MTPGLAASGARPQDRPAAPTVRGRAVGAGQERRGLVGL